MKQERIGLLEVTEEGISTQKRLLEALEQDREEPTTFPDSPAPTIDPSS